MTVEQVPNDVRIFAAAAKLPTAPRVLVQLGLLIHDPNTESDQIVDLLRRDAGIVAALIRMANSAAFAPPEPIGSLDRAISFVGFTEVHRLVGVLAASQMVDQKFSWYTVTPSQLRLHTLFVGLLMEEMANWTSERPSTCYTVGLLRPVGVMVLEQLAPAPGATPFASNKGMTLEEWERKIWGVTNADVSEKVLMHWRVPHEIVTAVRHHYRPQGRISPLVHLLSLAASIASHHFQGIAGEERYWSASPEALARAKLDQRLLNPIVEKAKRKLDRLKMAIM